MASSQFDELKDYYGPILGRLGDIAWQANGNGTCCCPAHDDHNRSMSVKFGRDGELLFKCHGDKGCDFPRIVAALGVEARACFYHPDHPPQGGPAERLVGKWDYTDQHGEILYQSLRFLPKRFMQRRPDPQRDGGWINNLEGVVRVPFRLPDLFDAEPDRAVFVVEGEAKVEVMEAMGFLATCNAAGAEKWPVEWGEAHFKGRAVAILPDHDEKGWRHAGHVAKCLAASAGAIRFVELPGLRLGEDVKDWRNRVTNTGHAIDMVKRAYRDAPIFDPAADATVQLKMFRCEIARAMALSGAV